MIIKICDPRENVKGGAASWEIHDNIEYFKIVGKDTRRYIYVKLSESSDTGVEEYKIARNRRIQVSPKDGDSSKVAIDFSFVPYCRSYIYILGEDFWEVLVNEKVSSIHLFDETNEFTKSGISAFKYINYVEAVIRGKAERQHFFFDTFAYILNDEGKTIETIR